MREEEVGVAMREDRCVLFVEVALGVALESDQGVDVLELVN